MLKHCLFAVLFAVGFSSGVLADSPPEIPQEDNGIQGMGEHWMDGWTVNTNDDQNDGVCNDLHCSLREAINAASASPQGGMISFELPVLPYTILLTEALPPIDNKVVLDGETQAGTVCPVPTVQLDGSQIADPAANGLVLEGNHNTVRGLIISSFPANGVLVLGNNNILECLFVGTDPEGMEPAGNGGHGVAVAGNFSTTIGADAEEGANLISGNHGQGIYIESSINTEVLHNNIGTDLVGRPSIPNSNTPLPPVLPPPSPSPLGDPAAVEAVTLEAQLFAERIVDEQKSALTDSRLLQEYTGHLSDLGARFIPSTYIELISELSRYPDLMEAFIIDVNEVNDDAAWEAASSLGLLAERVRPLVPEWGRDAVVVEEDLSDQLAELLREYEPDEYVVSGDPTSLITVDRTPGPVEINPLNWHSLRGSGYVDSGNDVDQLESVQTCLDDFSPCYWPFGYDLYPWATSLWWTSITLTQQEIDNIVAENGYLLVLWLNGVLLEVGPAPADGASGENQAFWAASMPSGACPPNTTCLVTSLLRDALRDIPQPWEFRLEIQKLTELNPPIIGGIDPNGNPWFITHATETISESSKLIQPNLYSGGTSWFEEKLIPTFQHPRCTDCHGFENETGLWLHHDFIGGSDVDEFIAYTKLERVSSLYVAGAHTMTCNNCHDFQLDKIDPDGHPFHEIHWLTPFEDLDLNWSNKTAAQICDRVITNLPNYALRHQHFHGDSRLHWAITDGNAAGIVLGTAPPHDWGEFLRRVDVWNEMSVPCP